MHKKDFLLIWPLIFSFKDQLMTAAPRGSKLAKFLNHRVNVVIGDHRYFVGQLLAFDSHSNIVLKDGEEYKK